MKYILIQENSVYGLQKEVERLLAKGYKLQGGVCVLRNVIGEEYFYQAVYKP